MRILFYSLNSHCFDGNAVQDSSFPPLHVQWQHLAEQHPEHQFILAAHLPGMFLFDLNKNDIAEKAPRVQYEIIRSDDEKAAAAFLASLRPDCAVAATSYTAPYDWLTIKDALAANFLAENGIRTICNSVQTGIDCFDKWRTHQFLEKERIPCPKAVHIHHELLINAGNRREIKSNVYKSYVQNELRTLRYPIIIKDTSGLSSYGAEVLGTYEEALAFLKSKRNTADKIAEELVSGEHCGLEIHGTPGNYTVLPPFLFSVNKYGITSPRQSVKAGPVTAARYRLETLNECMERLAEAMEFRGTAQVDLVFDGENWTVIEINPRLSGMSATYAASMGITLPELLFNAAFGRTDKTPRLAPAVNIKFQILSDKQRAALQELPYVASVHQTENKNARQLRERGYCEAVITGGTKDSLMTNLLALKSRFPEELEDSFLTSAQELVGRM